jgi:hypothetical protein
MVMLSSSSSMFDYPAYLQVCREPHMHIYQL